jgi:hypothetical protein
LKGVRVSDKRFFMSDIRTPAGMCVSLGTCLTLEVPLQYTGGSADFLSGVEKQRNSDDGEREDCDRFQRPPVAYVDKRPHLDGRDKRDHPEESAHDADQDVKEFHVRPQACATCVQSRRRTNIIVMNSECVQGCPRRWLPSFVHCMDGVDF